MKPEEVDVDRKCPQCGRPVPVGGVGRPRRFCTDECRKQWHNDTSIRVNELGWRRSFPPTDNNLLEIERLEAWIEARR
jgi:hypothetical protein